MPAKQFKHKEDSKREQAKFITYIRIVSYSEFDKLNNITNY